MKSALEEEFNKWLIEKDLIKHFKREFPIEKPEYLWKSRKSSWKIDFLSEELKIAVEIQGGTFIAGGHSRGNYQHSDFDKANYLQNLGYDIYFLDTKHVRNQSYQMVLNAILQKFINKQK
jgi:very-short-patch-repair endonuclease